jgi:hypothetical protein
LPATIAVGMIMSGPTYQELLFARGCFLVSAAGIALTTFGTLWFYDNGGSKLRVMAGAAFSGVIIWGLLFVLDWTRSREISSSETQVAQAAHDKRDGAKVSGNDEAIGKASGQVSPPNLQPALSAKRPAGIVFEGITDSSATNIQSDSGIEVRDATRFQMRDFRSK